MKNKQIQWFKSKTFQFLTVVLMTFSLHQNAFAATFTVNSLSDAGTGGCTAGECTLREAITAADSAGTPSVIEFQAGLTGTITLSSELSIDFSDLEIIGPGPEVITVSGNNNSRVFNISFFSSHVSISGLTIANGNTTEQGAGIYVRGDDTLLENLRIINNTTTFIGGGINVFGATTTIRNSEISGNTAARGSGISINGGDGDHVLVENVTVSGNTGNQGESGIGVLTNTGQNVALRYVTVAENSGSPYGVILSGNGNITVEASIFYNNSASVSDLNPGTNVTVNNSIIGSTNNPITGMNNLLAADPLLSSFDYFNGSALKVYALENGQSVALDHVDDLIGDAQCELLVTSDQLGQIRPINNRCDAGAFESPGIPSYPPELDFIGNQSIDELDTLSFTATATDPDTNPADLAFTLAGEPAGASISLAGDFTFTPTETQGPNSYTFDVIVSDDGQPLNIDSETITVTVNEVNQNPVLDTILNQNVMELETLNFSATASDADLPAQTLSFSLSGEPAGASITSTGDFSFTPTQNQGPGSYTFDVIVTDDGPGNISDSQSITITVENDDDLIFINGFE